VDEKEIALIVEKNKADPIFQGTLVQIGILKQLKQHLTKEAARYRNDNRMDVADFIMYSITDTGDSHWRSE
jgi:hypothetical protein